MVSGFWQDLRKPFVALAPMEDVTTFEFREEIASSGKPDVMFTEFTNVEGLNSRGYDKLVGRLKYSENQRPIVAQIWGLDPDNFYRAAKMIADMGFDGVDINLGCPQEKVMKINACAAMIGKEKLVGEIVQAAREGAGILPVSVKTRTGIKEANTREWVSMLLTMGLSAITLHARTAIQRNNTPADWEQIRIAAALPRETLIIGNGDIKSIAEGKSKAVEYGADGVMIGRAAIMGILK